MEMVREPGEMEDRGMTDSPVLSVREARAVKTVALGRVIPDDGRILFGDWLVMEIWPVGRREEPESEG